MWRVPKLSRSGRSLPQKHPSREVGRATLYIPLNRFEGTDVAKDKPDTAASFDKQLDAVRAVLRALDGLSAEGKAWVLRTVAEALGQQAPAGAGAPPSATPLGAPPPAPTAIGNMKPKEFLAAKRPVTDVERVACLAYYLTYALNQPHFKTRDITELNTKAAGIPFANAARSVNNAAGQSGFLAPAGKGNKQITPHGEDVVNALPNREAVTALLAQAPTKRRRRGRANRAAAK
jgi:hypothetical protein